MIYKAPTDPHPLLNPATVYLVGGGPGDPELLTLKAKRIIETADVVLYDYLVDTRILQWIRSDARNPAEKIYVGKSAIHGHAMSQNDIEALMIEKAKTGKTVCRLKGGDPYVFGRGAEEAETLRKAGIKFEVIPGISSSIAAPAYAGIPVTHREDVSAFTVITGHEDPTKSEFQIDWADLATRHGTLILLMGVKQLPTISENLITHGKKADTPVALVEWGTRPQQRTVTGTLSTIAEIAANNNMKPPCVIVIGEVVRHREQLNWFEELPLFGKTIVITRSREQSSSLRQRLENLGAKVIEFPTIQIEPVQDTQPLQLALKNINQYQWLILTSPNAVKTLINYCFDQGLDVRALANIKIAVIGPATRDTLKEVGLNADLIPPEFVAESLLESLKEKISEFNGLRFLMPRADIARDMLPNALRELGAVVDDIALYNTTCPSNGEDVEQLQQVLLTEKIDYITFTSSSTAHNFAQRLEKVLTANPEILNNIQLASIGPITSEAVLKNFSRVDVEASTFTIDGLISAILYANEKKLVLL